MGGGGRIVQGAGHLQHLFGIERRGRHGNRAYRDALVDHRNTVLVADFIADFYQISGGTGDAGIDVVRETSDVVAGAIQQVEPQGDGSNVQVFIFKHLHDGEDFSITEHGRLPYTRLIASKISLC